MWIISEFKLSAMGEAGHFPRGWFYTLALPDQDLPPSDAVWNYHDIINFDDSSYQRRIKLTCVPACNTINSVCEDILSFTHTHTNMNQ